MIGQWNDGVLDIEAENEIDRDLLFQLNYSIPKGEGVFMFSKHDGKGLVAGIRLMRQSLAEKQGNVMSVSEVVQ